MTKFLPDVVPFAHRRRSKDTRVNLSSNELRHPAVNELVKKMFSNFDYRDLIRYPIYDSAICCGAEFFGFNPTEVLLSPGSDAAIRMLLMIFRGSGYSIILQEPNYEAWTTGPEIRKWPVTKVPSPDGTANGSIEALLRAIGNSSPCIVVISWPNSPGGYAPDLASVTELSRKCQRHGHFLVVDACYAGFFCNLREIFQMAARHCLVLMSWSKLFGVAGGRLALLAGAYDILELFIKHGLEQHVGVPMLCVFSNTPLVYENFRVIWREISEQRTFIQSTLRARGLRIPDSGGNFLHVDCSTAEKAESITRRLSIAGFRVRNMGEVKGLLHHVRFTVGIGEDDDHFIKILENEAAIL